MFRKFEPHSLWYQFQFNTTIELHWIQMNEYKYVCRWQWWLLKNIFWHNSFYQVTSENNLTIKGVAVVPLNSRADVFLLLTFFTELAYHWQKNKRYLYIISHSSNCKKLECKIQSTHVSTYLLTWLPPQVYCVSLQLVMRSFLSTLLPLRYS